MGFLCCSAPRTLSPEPAPRRPSAPHDAGPAKRALPAAGASEAPFMHGTPLEPTSGADVCDDDFVKIGELHSTKLVAAVASPINPLFDGAEGNLGAHAPGSDHARSLLRRKEAALAQGTEAPYSASLPCTLKVVSSAFATPSPASGNSFVTDQAGAPVEAHSDAAAAPTARRRAHHVTVSTAPEHAQQAPEPAAAAQSPLRPHARAAQPAASRTPTAASASARDTPFDTFGTVPSSGSVAPHTDADDGAGASPFTTVASQDSGTILNMPGPRPNTLLPTSSDSAAGTTDRLHSTLPATGSSPKQRAAQPASLQTSPRASLKAQPDSQTARPYQKHPGALRPPRSGDNASPPAAPPAKVRGEVSNGGAALNGARPHATPALPGTLPSPPSAAPSRGATPRDAAKHSAPAAPPGDTGSAHDRVAALISAERAPGPRSPACGGAAPRASSTAANTPRQATGSAASTPRLAAGRRTTTSTPRSTVPTPRSKIATPQATGPTPRSTPRPKTTRTPRTAATPPAPMPSPLTPSSASPAPRSSKPKPARTPQASTPSPLAPVPAATPERPPSEPTRERPSDTQARSSERRHDTPTPPPEPAAAAVPRPPAPAIPPAALAAPQQNGQTMYDKLRALQTAPAAVHREASAMGFTPPGQQPYVPAAGYEARHASSGPKPPMAPSAAGLMPTALTSATAQHPQQRAYGRAPPPSSTGSMAGGYKYFAPASGESASEQGLLDAHARILEMIGGRQNETLLASNRRGAATHRGHVRPRTDAHALAAGARSVSSTPRDAAPVVARPLTGAGASLAEQVASQLTAGSGAEAAPVPRPAVDQATAIAAAARADALRWQELQASNPPATRPRNRMRTSISAASMESYTSARSTGRAGSGAALPSAAVAAALAAGDSGPSDFMDRTTSGSGWNPEPGAFATRARSSGTRRFGASGFSGGSHLASQTILSDAGDSVRSAVAVLDKYESTAMDEDEFEEAQGMAPLVGAWQTRSSVTSPRLLITNDSADGPNGNPACDSDEASEEALTAMTLEAPSTLRHREGGVTSAIEGMKKSFIRPSKRQVTYIKRIGVGGYGHVWLAECDGERMALKQLIDPIPYEPLKQAPTDVLTLLPFAEAALQSLMVHTNIARILWADVSVLDPKTEMPLDLSRVFGTSTGGRAGGKGADPDQPWTAVTDFINADFTTAFAEQDNLPDVVHLNMRIAMELCDLGSLKDFVEVSSSGRRPVPMHIALARGMDASLCAALTALDVARGLRLLHLNNIVHGDLKPGNILFASDPADPRTFVAKVADFGLSARLHKEQQSVSITAGSVAYLPKEALQDRAMSKPTDVYAFGLLMWELWHQRFWSAVYEGERTRRRCDHFAMFGYKPKCHHTCPKEYSDIVDMCLQSDAAKRPTFKRVIVRELESMMHAIHQRSSGAAP